MLNVVDGMAAEYFFEELGRQAISGSDGTNVVLGKHIACFASMSFIMGCSHLGI